MHLLKDIVIFLTFLFSLSLFTSCNTEPEETVGTPILKNSFFLIEDSIHKIPWNKKDKCFIQINENGDTLPIKAKYRGGMSSQYYKHSFSVAFAKDTILFEDWKSDDDYIFNANYIDKTFIRHRLSYDLFKLFTPTNIAPKSHFKNLYLNNDYQGLYLVMQEVDRSLLEIKKTDTTAFILKDGALFSDYIDGYPTQEGEDVFQQKYPKKQTKKNTLEIKKVWNLLHCSSDTKFKETIANHFNIDNIIDWHLLLLLTNNGDGVTKNFYWYKKNNGLWNVVPWDYDDSFGRNGDGTLQTNLNHCNWQRNILLKRLFNLNVNNYKSKLKDKWNNIRNNGLNLAKVQELINQYYTELNPQDLENNFNKWPINDANYSDSLDYKEELELIYNYIPKKIKEIDSLTTLWETQLITY